MSLYTPRPWEVEYTNNGIETNVCGPIRARFNRVNEIMRVEAEANARLIAAAPDLLAALKETVTVIYSFHGEAGWKLYQSSPEMKLITTTIAKAEGQ